MSHSWVEELRSVFDPRGGYFKKGRYTPSIVAELGDVIECHLKMIGLIKSEEPDAHQQKYSPRSARNTKRVRRTKPRARMSTAASERRTTVREVFDKGGHQDGWLHDLSQLRRFEVRMMHAMLSITRSM